MALEERLASARGSKPIMKAKSRRINRVGARGLTSSVARRSGRCDHPGRRTMTTVKLTDGEYESAENILHLWFPHCLQLADEQGIRTFNDLVQRRAIAF